MDTQSLLADVKARFSHNSVKAYLTEKYSAKLLLADQGGLWKADKETISFLLTIQTNGDDVILVDTFGNPVKVNRHVLIRNLSDLYSNVMEEWYNEWKEVETKR